MVLLRSRSICLNSLRNGTRVKAKYIDRDLAPIGGTEATSAHLYPPSHSLNYERFQSLKAEAGTINKKLIESYRGYTY